MDTTQSVSEFLDSQNELHEDQGIPDWLQSQIEEAAKNGLTVKDIVASLLRKEHWPNQKEPCPCPGCKFRRGESNEEGNNA